MNDVSQYLVFVSSQGFSCFWNEHITISLQLEITNVIDHSAVIAYTVEPHY